MGSKGKLCLDCIWFDQCDGEGPCEDFDSGRYGEELLDDEIAVRIENNRKRFNCIYSKYESEYGDDICD